jgi:hypothetical protein
MRRRVPFQLLSGARIWIASAEDSIVRKLDWYRRGGEVSDRQWRDVLGPSNLWHEDRSRLS